MAERFYSGESDGQVTVREGAAKYPLNPRHDLLKDKAPAAFRSEGAWTEQLALALFADAYGNETRAIRLYERLHQRVVMKSSGALDHLAQPHPCPYQLDRELLSQVIRWLSQARATSQRPSLSTLPHPRQREFF